MHLLGADGQPVQSTDEVAVPAGAPRPAPIPLGTRAISLQDGPLRVRVNVEFEDLKIGGADRGKFEKAIDAVFARSTSVAMRATELMILGAIHGKDVAPLVIGLMNDLKGMRVALEMILSRVQSGLDPIPTVQVAQAVAEPAVK